METFVQAITSEYLFQNKSFVPVKKRIMHTSLSDESENKPACWGRYRLSDLKRSEYLKFLNGEAS